MNLPHYYLRRPALELAQPTIEAFEALWENLNRAPSGAEISYTLAEPRWKFLCYLADTRPVVLHGSGQRDIAIFEPRQADDILEFGNRAAVYAASDGIWPMFYAILDRDQYPMSLTNSCTRIASPGGELSEPSYFFSISETALVHRPWREGMIYLLPRESFTPQLPIPAGNFSVHVLQWASTAAVAPLAKLAVRPGDFPFLDQIRGHNDEIQMQRARANPEGFPWVDE